ncbi:hypothetical protein [Luteimonas abyssi]|uniref:hypothetical protein n=1 Tax=Luteimonas abyssi TaxID=1247514 RepID=UPI000737D1FD|nr:hypothetical protein [Luteimonas abyssi]
MRLPLLSFSLLCLLVACATPVEPTSRNATSATDVTTQADCAARGGEWKQLGRAPVQQCLLPTSDAGKACNDGTQCEGLCLAADGASDGTMAEGTCSVDTNVFGCQTRIDGGTATTLCVD